MELSLEVEEVVDSLSEDLELLLNLDEEDVVDMGER